MDKPNGGDARQFKIVPGEDEQLQEGQLRYLVSFPPGYEPGTESLPVLCFLHGEAEAGPMRIREAAERHGPLKGGKAAAAIDRFIIVVPQLPEEHRGDNWHRYAAEVRRIVAEVPDRNLGQTYLTGFSYGGNGALSIAADSDPEAPKDFWAAVWAVDPTTVAASPPSCRLWLSMGPFSWQNAGRYKQLIPDLVQLDLKAAAGKLNASHVALDEGFHKVEKPPPGKESDHVKTATMAYGRDWIYDWLTAGVRPAKPAVQAKGTPAQPD